MPDPWEQPAQDPWEQPEAQQQPSPVDPAQAKLSPSIGALMHAFGENFSQDYEEKLGLSDETKKFLGRHNVLPKDTADYSNPLKPFMAFNEGIILPLAAGLDAAWRLPFAVYRGMQGAGVAAGLPGDIVSLPDAFMGSPGALAVPHLAKPQPYVRSSYFRPVEVEANGIRQVDPGIARSVAAKTGLPEVDAVLNSPTTKAAIDNAVIDRSHDVPYMAGGSVPLEDPTVYIDRHVPREQTVPRLSGKGAVTFDPADPWAVHENVEQHTMELLIKGGMADQEAYRVAHFEYAEKAEQAWYRAHDIDQEVAEREQLSWLPRIQHENPENPPPNLYRKPYPHDSVAGAQHEAVTEAPSTPDEIARARDIIARHANELQSGGIVAYHGSPHAFEKFDISKIGTGEGAQAFGHGLYFAENEEVAKEYRESLSALRPTSEVERLQKVGPPGGRLYQVSIKADPEHFLDWDKPLSEQSGKNQKTLYDLMWNVRPQLAQEAKAKDWSGQQIHTALSKELDEAAYLRNVQDQRQGRTRSGIGASSDALRAAGIPGIKYLDQGSRGIRTPQEARDMLPSAREDLSKDPGNKQLQIAVKQLERDAAAPEPTRNYVVFDDKVVTITHIDGKPILPLAQDLGVVGPPRPPITQGKPAEAAARAIDRGPSGPTGPAGPAGPAGPSPDGAPPEPSANPWRDRFEHFVGKLDTADDVKQLIREAADDKNEFPAARQGDIPLSHVDAIAQAAGVEPSEINVRGLGRALKNDNEVRIAMQLMLQVTENVKAAAREVRADGSSENLIKLQESIMRRDLAVEQVVGLRAEWGRTGNVFQEFLRDVKDQEGLSDFLKKKGRSADDLRDIANAVDSLDREGAAKVLNDLRGKQMGPVYWTWVNGLIAGPLTHTKYIFANALYAGVERGVTTPIASMIGKAKQLAGLNQIGPPPVPSGHTRLFRVEPLKPAQEAKISDWIKETPEYQKTVAATGRWFAADQENVEWYKQHLRNDRVEPKVTYVDVPTEKAEQYRVSNLSDKEVQSFSRRPEEEFFLPRELADRRADLSREVDRVFFGEGAAATWGLLSATPTSLMTAARGLRSGMRVPLDSEVALRDAMIARGEKVPATLERSVNPVTGQVRPIPGIWGRIIGAPGDAASAIHIFFKVMGERASIEAEAYHQAAAEGLNPTDARFWSRRAELAANPTEVMRQKAVDEAYRGTFMQELGPRGKAFQRFVKDTPGLRWMFPFTHIPIDLMKATYEYTPAAILDSDLRSALKGEKGGRAQDMAIARMAGGSALMGWFANTYLNGRATGDLPRDQKERDVWKLEGKQPNSILIGDHWVSFARFGPAGDLANLGANIGAVIQYLKSDDDDAMTKATYHAAEAAAHIVVDEVGFQSLANLFEAYHDPDRRGAQWVASTAASFLPYSSLLGQTASVMDPYGREAKTIIDGIKYKIPGARETLLPKRDWSGAPLDNPQYGNIIRQRVVNSNPVDMEMERLGIHAAPPSDRIGSVKLPPRLYDQYQVAAGTLTRAVLENWVKQPTWYDMPPFAREEVFRKSIMAARQQAAAMIQQAHPEIIRQGVENVLNHIQGNKPTKLKDAD